MKTTTTRRALTAIEELRRAGARSGMMETVATTKPESLLAGALADIAHGHTAIHVGGEIHLLSCISRPTLDTLRNLSEPGDFRGEP